MACVFGTGAWVAINGLWVELPLIVNELPEGWYLPSYLTIIIQMANIGPLFVTIMHKWRPGRLKEVWVIYTIITLGIVALFLMAFFWKATTWIGGQLHSTGFLVLTFFLSSVDCTSSVTFLPFMMQLQPKYITTYFIGEGLSGLIPGLLSLIQGVGLMKCINATHSENETQGWFNAENVTQGWFNAGNVKQGWFNASEDNNFVETHYPPANFSVQVFIFLLFIMMLFCWVAFFFLTRYPQKKNSNNALLQSTNTLNSYSMTDVTSNAETFEVSKRGESTSNVNSSESEENKVKYSYGQYALIYFLTAWVNALTNGVLPSIQTYSCMPYGNLAYHLAVALGAMANPLACLIAMFLPSR